jgi:SAM-dependent methyltransferase
MSLEVTAAAVETAVRWETARRELGAAYGLEYWEHMDGGAGAQDSTMREDIAHTIKEVFGIDRAAGRDASGKISVIEFGCGYGFLVRHLRRRGFDAWGVDISDYALEHADPETATYLRWFDMTGPNPTQFRRQSFKLALCFETMEHIPEKHLDVALGHIFDLLAHGGQALFGICTSTRPGWDSDPTHVTIKSREWWIREIKRAGFVFTQDDLLNEVFLKQHWLFSEHDGVFAVSKP